MKKNPAKQSRVFRFFCMLVLAAPALAEPSLPPASVVINPPSRGDMTSEPLPGGKVGGPVSTSNPGSEGVSRSEPPSLQTAKPSTSAKPAKPTATAKAVAAAKPEAPAIVCAAAAITCIEIASTGNRLQASVPTTFGQPFRMGDWQHRQEGLAAKDNLGNTVSLQHDQISSHQNGSARFAVLSTEVKNLQPQERRVVSIFSTQEKSKTPAPAKGVAADYRVEATIYHPQITVVQFGDRKGHAPGIAFTEGEQITLTLSGPVTERYSIALTGPQAGGGHTTLTFIADAFMQAINSQSKTYLAEKPGGGFESLWIRTSNPEGGSFQVKMDYSGPAKIQHTNQKEYEKPQVWTAQTPNPINKQTTPTARGALRLQGPVVSETQLVLPFRNAVTGAEHPHLVTRLDVRTYPESGAVWTDAVFENNWTFKDNPGNLHYELTIYANGKKAHYQPPFTHYHHARWHKAFWSDTAPDTTVRHHMPYFMSSAAVWNYDLSVSIPEKVLIAEAENLAEAQTKQQALGPMKNVFLQPAFTNTGGRPEIAPLPRWTALYLVSQDPRAFASMMANADAAASVPIHYRSEKTDQPVEPIANPELTLYGDGNVPKSSDRTIWLPDTAHQGSFTYVPYLITGDRFYLDEMLFWASWSIVSFPVDYRAKEKALIHRQQVRGQAWVLRALAEADRSLPDAHVLKAPFKKILGNNLAWYKENFVDKENAYFAGAVTRVRRGKQNASTWQNDFLVTIFALLAENKEPHSKEIHAWLSLFSVERFLSDDKGFCAARAPGYYWIMEDDAGKAYTRWNEIYQENYPKDIGKSCDSLVVTGGYPNSPASYAAYARGMLGASANAGYQNAAKAYFKWKSMTPGIDNSVHKNPSWAIIPR